jgi:hypothetical protein
MTRSADNLERRRRVITIRPSLVGSPQRSLFSFEYIATAGTRSADGVRDAGVPRDHQIRRRDEGEGGANRRRVDTDARASAALAMRGRSDQFPMAR